MFARGANPIWFFNNLTGQVLDDTYYAFFQENTLPYLPQTVWQDPNGATPWSDPIEFQPSGGLPNNLYGNPAEVYRIEVRQGPTQSDPLIWLIENYVFGNGGGSSTIISDQLLIAENMVTNPQFVDTYFGDTVTLTTAGTYLIAPGWYLILTGTGSTTITQNTNPGISNITGNPAYYMEFNSSGWGSVKLVQTFTNNGSIFANGAIAIAFSAFSTGTDFDLVVSYVPSDGAGFNISTFDVLAGAFNEYKTAVNVGASNNTDIDGDAFVNLQFALPNTGIIALTNIQLTGQSDILSPDFVANPDALAPPYDELTYERMVDHEFNVYRNSLVYQPKDSILTGWNFGLNPWQLVSPTPANVATNQYTADQTIIIQQNYVAAAVGNNISVGRASVGNNYGLQATAVTAHNQFAILQYIDPATIRPYWGQIVSAMVKLALTTTHGTNTLKVKMRLIYKAGLPATVAQADPIATWTEGSDPGSYAAGWTAIIPENDPIYTITTEAQEFSFNRFQLPASTNANMTLGVLVYTIGNMDQTATADFLVINDVSLVRNDFAIATQPQTFDEVLRQCQYYYEKSYNINVYPQTVTNVGVSSCLTSDAAQIELLGMDRTFKVTKRTTPATVWISPAVGTVGSVTNVTGANADVAIDHTEFTGNGNTGAPVATMAPGDVQVITGHWVDDARLGI